MHATDTTDKGRHEGCWQYGVNLYVYINQGLKRWVSLNEQLKKEERKFWHLLVQSVDKDYRPVSFIRVLVAHHSQRMIVRFNWRLMNVPRLIYSVVVMYGTSPWAIPTYRVYGLYQDTYSFRVLFLSLAMVVCQVGRILKFVSPAFFILINLLIVAGLIDPLRWACSS